MITDIKDAITLYFRELAKNPQHRYRSWEHCYDYFQKLRTARSEEVLDHATLHLAFFLASWGMYRGSSRLLQRDYTVHRPVVDVLLQSGYDSVWSLNLDSLNQRTIDAGSIIRLIRALKQSYEKVGVTPTDTLVTKVLLGTIACIPAYDTYFLDGIGYWNDNLRPRSCPRLAKSLRESSYQNLVRFYQDNASAFQAANDDIARYGLRYPSMKLVDMYFWIIGYQLAERR